jgi:hypothetical protein
MRTILRLWFLVTAGLFAGAMIWVFVPVLVPMIGITVAMGGLVVCIVGFARMIERLKGGHPPKR